MSNTQKGWRKPRKQRPLNEQDWHTHEFIETVAAFTGLALLCIKWSSRADTCPHP